MTKFAENTKVSSEASRLEIERTLERYGASAFMYAKDEHQALMAFDINDRRIKLRLPMPDKKSAEFTRTPTGKPRVANQIDQVYEQAVRQRWRALALVIKAKLEAVEAGISVFDEEFLAFIQLPNGQTVGDFMTPQIELSYMHGIMPPLLPAPDQ